MPLTDIDPNAVPDMDTTPFVTGERSIAKEFELSENDLESLYRIAYMYTQQARYADAHPILRLLVICDIHSPKYWHSLAACRQMLGDHLLAAESYAVLAGLELNDPQPAIQAAFCLMQGNDIQSAETWIVEAERRLTEGKGNPEQNALCRRLRVSLEKRLGKTAGSKSTNNVPATS